MGDGPHHGLDAACEVRLVRRERCEERVRVPRAAGGLGGEVREVGALELAGEAEDALR